MNQNNSITNNKNGRRGELCSPKENKEPPLVVQGEVNFAKKMSLYSIFDTM